MNRGKTGLRLIAMTGTCGQLSGTTTVAGKAEEYSDCPSGSSLFSLKHKTNH